MTDSTHDRPVPVVDEQEARGRATRLGAWFDAALTGWGLRSAFARDTALALVAAVFSLVLLGTVLVAAAEQDGVRFSSATVIGLATLVLAQSSALCVRRSRPLLCWGIVTAAQIGLIAFLPPDFAFLGFGVPLAAYTCGTLLSFSRLLRALVVVTAAQTLLGALLAGRLTQEIGEAVSPGPVSSLTGFFAVCVVMLLSVVSTHLPAAFAGNYVVARHSYAELTRLRAAEEVRAHRERANNAVRTERARMARELHDVAAHHLSGLVVQAGAVERLIGRDDPAAREAVTWIRHQGRETLDGLRLVVGALREPEEDRAWTDGAPLPGLGALDRLLATELALGSRVDLVREGQEYTLPPVADVTFYRVAQEALSNARDHAPGEPVRLTVRFGSAETVLEAHNPLAASSPGGEDGSGRVTSRGMGLLGMRERAQLIGAVIEAGPVEDGPGGPEAWRVRLALPAGRGSSAWEGRQGHTEEAK